MPSVIDNAGVKVGELPVPAIFAADAYPSEHVMFRAVFRELSNKRSGNHSTKRRDEVSGGGRKPWRQKGTGRARQGSTRSPQWTHGGVVFGPKPHSHEVSLNKKERAVAMRAALTNRFSCDSVTVFSGDQLPVEKTRAFATLLFGNPKDAKGGPRTLVVYGNAEADGLGASLQRAGGNLQRVKVTQVGLLDVKDVLGYARLFVTAAAFDELSSIFGGNK